MWSRKNNKQMRRRASFDACFLLLEVSIELLVVVVVVAVVPSVDYRSMSPKAPSVLGS